MRGHEQRPLPVAEAGSCEWLRKRGAASGRNSRAGAGAAVQICKRTACTTPIWVTATRSSAPVFASARRGAPQKSAKRKRRCHSALRCDGEGNKKSAPPFLAEKWGASMLPQAQLAGNLCRQGRAVQLTCTARPGGSDARSAPRRPSGSRRTASGHARGRRGSGGCNGSR